MGALLPHAHALAALSVLLLLGFGLWKNRGVFRDPISKNVKIYLLFWCFSLSGAVLPLARAATLLTAVLRLAFFLPWLFPERREDFRRALALLGGALGIWASAELLLGGGMQGTVDEARFSALARAAGPFGNPNVLAAFLLPSAVLSLSLALFEKRGRALFLLSYFLTCAGIAATFCRGAMLALFLVSLLLFMKKYGAATVCTAMLAALPLLLLLLPASLTARLASVLSPDTSVFYRFSLWKSIARLPPRALLFGAGEGREAMHALLFPVLAAGLSHVEHTHSLPLQLLVSTGILGLSLFLACVFFAFRGRGTDRFALLSLLLFGLFDDPLYNGQTEVIFWITMGLCTHPSPISDGLR